VVPLRSAPFLIRSLHSLPAIPFNTAVCLIPPFLSHGRSTPVSQQRRIVMALSPVLWPLSLRLCSLPDSGLCAAPQSWMTLFPVRIPLSPVPCPLRICSLPVLFSVLHHGTECPCPLPLRHPWLTSPHSLSATVLRTVEGYAWREGSAQIQDLLAASSRHQHKEAGSGFRGEEISPLTVL